MSKLDLDYGLEQALNSGPISSTKVFLAEPIPLTSKKRRSLPDTEFAYVAFGPKGKKIRKYPINDAGHAKNAMARLNGQYNKGKLTDKQYNKIYSRILKAYKKFGIKSSKPSAIEQIKREEVVLPMAAEPGVDGFSAKCMESKMVTKAQRRAIALKNLRKAWKAKGMNPTFEPAGEPRAKAAKKLTKAQRAAISRKNIKKAQAARRKASPAFVYEPKPRAAKKTTKPTAKKRKTTEKSMAGTGASRGRTLTKYQYEQAEKKRLAEIKKQQAEAKKRVTAKKRAATRAKPKVSKRGTWERTVPVGTYKNQKEGNVIQIKRVYSKRNPDWSKPAIMASAAGGVILGVVVSDLADRFFATMAPQGADTPLYGDNAIAAIRTKTNAWRLGTSFTGTVIGLGGSYLLMDKENLEGSSARDIGSVMLGGFGVAFGVKFLTQVITDVFMPIIFKVDSSTEQSISNRLYADKQDYAGISATDTTDNGSGVMGVGKRPNIYRLPSVRSSFGPVATKSIGTAGCGGSGPAHSFLANVAKAQVGAAGCGNKECGGSTCADGACADPNIPSYMQKRGGGKDTPGQPYTPGVRVPSTPGPNTNVPAPQPFDPGMIGRLQVKEPTMPAIMAKDELFQYRLNMPDAPSMMVPGVKGVGTAGVGTAGVYGHLFKKAV